MLLVAFRGHRGIWAGAEQEGRNRVRFGVGTELRVERGRLVGGVGGMVVEEDVLELLKLGDDEPRTTRARQ